MRRKFQLRRTTVITMGLLAFLAGLGLARTGIYFSGYFVGLAALICLSFSKRLKNIGVITVIILGLSAGWWRGSVFIQKLAPYKNLTKESVVLQVKADSDGVYGKNTQLEFDGANVRIIKPYQTTVPGKVKIGGFGENAVYRGDIVQAEGKLFPTRGSRQASIGFATIKVLGRGDSPVDKIRLKFIAGMESALPEPLASFALGLLIGQRTTIPDTISQQLSTVGLTHIIAVSGYNLTIIVEAVRRLTGKRSKYQSTILSLALILLFLMVTGLSASIVRAAIVSVLSLTAWYYGRTFRPLLLLSLAAVLTAGWNPLYLWSDVGWYLSFLAFYGILVLVPLAIRRLFGRNKPKTLTVLFMETLGAQIMTAPFILYIFGVTSSVAIFSNLMIVPLVPLGMLLAVIAGLAGMIIAPLAGWLAWPAKVLLTYMLDIVNILSRIPHAAISASLPLASLIILYVSLTFICFVMWHRTEKAADKSLR
jgi:competence protein ComEC